MRRLAVMGIVLGSAALAAGQDYAQPEASEEPGVRGEVRADSQVEVELAAGNDRWLTYTIYVPEGAQQLHVEVTGSEGDIDVFLRHEQAMDDWFAEADHRAATGLGDEILLVDAHCDPALRPGKYYLDVVRATEDSIPPFKVTVRYDHVDADTYLRRAQMRRSVGDAQGAIDDCARVLGLDPERGDAYRQRALARSELPEPDRAGAAADFAQALKRDASLEGELAATIEANQELSFKLGEDDRYRSYKLIVPAGCQALRIETVAAQQDLDLFLRYGLPIENWQEDAEHHGDSRRMSEELFVDGESQPPLLAGVYYLDVFRAGAPAPGEAITLRVTFDPTIDLAKDAAYWFTRGYAAAERLDYEAAADRYGKALAIEPDPLTHFNRAAMRRALRDYEASNADLDAALTLAPELDYKGTLLFLRGNNHLFLGDVEAAIRDLRAAVKLSPEDPKVHTSLGRCLLEQGEVSAALASLQRALELDPQHGDAYYHLAQLRAAQGDREAGLELYEQALSLGASDAEVWKEAVSEDQTLVVELPAGVTNCHTVLLEVPAGVRAVRVKSVGANADVDLFARHGLPLRNWNTDPDHRAESESADESLEIPTAQPGRYFLDVARRADQVGKFQVVISFVREG